MGTKIGNFNQQTIKSLIGFACIAVAASLPLVNLLIWESDLRFQHSLSLRVFVVWIELLLCFALMLSTRPNLIHSIRQHPKVTFTISAFVVLGFISALYAHQPYAALVRHSEILLHIIFVYLLSFHAQTKFAHYVILTGVLLAIAYTAFHFLLMRLAIGDQIYDWVRNIPFYVNIRHWTYLHVLALPLSFTLITSVNQRIKVLGYIALFVIWTCIFWSGARAGLLTGIVVTGIYFIWINYNKKTLFKVAAAALFALAVAKSIEANNYSLSINRLFFLAFLEQPDADLNSISSSRIELAQNALTEVFNQSPWLGMGADSYRYSASALTSTPYAHPHNSVIHLIYEYGLSGFILIFCLLAWALRTLLQILRSKQTPHRAACYGLALLSCLITSLFCGILHHTFSLSIIGLVLAAFIGQVQTFRPEKPRTLDTKLSHSLFGVSILFTLIALVTVIWSLHSRTYLSFLQPLSSAMQIETIKEFPSVSLTNFWVGNSINNELLKDALLHGYQWSDTQCGHKNMLQIRFQLDITDSTIHCPQMRFEQ